MRTQRYLLLLALFFAACTRHDSTITPLTPPVTYKDTAAALPFITIQHAGDQLELRFPWDAQIAKVYLKKDTATIGVWTTTAEPYFAWRADIGYPFEAGKTYSFVLETTPVNNIANRYILRNYIHTYISAFTEQKLLSLTQSMGPNYMDISPSRKTLFIGDDIQNSVVVKKLSLVDGSVTTLNHLDYGLLRAVSDDEVLVRSDDYIGRRLGSPDSAVIVRYNLTTQQSSFVAFYNPGSARTSRVIDNHLLVTDPLNNMVLVSLADTTKRFYPYPEFNSVSIGQYNFDHLYYYNQRVDPHTGALTPAIPTEDSAAIEVMDSATGYTFGAWTSGADISNYHPAATYRSHLTIYRQGSKVYQNDDATSASNTIPRQIRMTGNKLVFLQQSGYDTTFHASGYYQLDLDTKRTTLLHSYYSPYVVEEFQLDPHTIISVRADGVYRVSIP